MDALALLRKLAQHKAYIELQRGCENYWHDSFDPAVLPLQVIAAAHLGQSELADKLYQQALEHQDEFAIDAVVDLASAALVTDRLEYAITLLEQVLQLTGNHALAKARLGYCRMLQEDFAAAQLLYRQALELAPELVAVRANLLQLYIKQNLIEQAQPFITQSQDVLAQQVTELPESLYREYRQQLSTMQLKLWLVQQQFARAENWLQLMYEQYQTQEQAPGQVSGQVPGRTGPNGEEEFVHYLVQYSRLLAESDLHLQAVELLDYYSKLLPHSTELAMQLAELVQLQGHQMQAVKLLRRALEQDNENIALLLQLTNASLPGLEQQARLAAERAVTLAQELEVSETMSFAMIKIKQAQAHNALAQVEYHGQNFELAEQLYRDILDDNQGFIPALLGLGQLQMQQGNIDQALALFERVKRLDPIKGQSALINAHRFPQESAALEKLEQAAQLPSLEGSVRSGILFQLAAAWEKRQDYTKAFDFASRANTASKKLLPYIAEAHRNQCARVRMRFSKALYQHRPYCGIDSSLPVYVVGMPRSGTTLVEQILAGHSDIFGAGELGVIPQLEQGLNRWERHVGSGRKYPDCIDDLTPYITQGIANNLLNELQEYAPGAKHVVDKLPHNFEYIGLIKFLFPKAKIISVRRDPRDIAISNYFTDFQAKHGGMGFAYDLEDIGQQLADHNLMMHHWHQIFPGEILEINYEDVVDDLAGSARKMLDYIGVEWQPQVLKFNQLKRSVKTASVWQVRQPIYHTSKAKWQRYRQHLTPLIRGSNAKIVAKPVSDMLTLPVPGLLQAGVDLYHCGKLDQAEINFKKMLHHNPQHAAANYMLGLVYLSKKHPRDGIAQIELAVQSAPWHVEWRDNLIKAYQLVGDSEKANQLKARQGQAPVAMTEDYGDVNAMAAMNDYRHQRAKTM